MLKATTKLPFGNISTKIIKFLKTRNTATLNQISSVLNISIRKIVHSLAILNNNRQIKYYIFNDKTFYILNSSKYCGWVFYNFYVKYILEIVDFNGVYYKECMEVELYLSVIIKLVCTVGISCNGLTSKEESFLDSVILYGFVKTVALEELIGMCKYNTNIDNEKVISSTKGVSAKSSVIKDVNNNSTVIKGVSNTTYRQQGVNNMDSPLNINKTGPKRLKGVKYYTLDLEALNHSILIYEGCKYIEKKYCKITRDVFSCIERCRGGSVNTIKGTLPYNLIDIELAVSLLKGVNILKENEGVNKEGFIVNIGMLKKVIKMDVLKGVIYNTSVIDSSIMDITFEGVNDIDIVKGGIIRVLNMLIDKGVLEDNNAVRSSLLSSKVLRMVQCMLLKIGMINLGIKDVIGKACYVWEECFEKGCYLIGMDLSDERDKLLLMI